MDCLFCKIVSGDLPAEIIYQDDKVAAFADINGQAPHHYLIIPRKHIATLNDVEEADGPLLGHMMQTAQRLAKQLDISEQGFRTVMNINAEGGQTVFHIHLHLLGGRQMNWPPG